MEGGKGQCIGIALDYARLQNIRAEVSDLKGSGGAVIPASALRTYFLRYITTDELSKDGKSGCGYRTNHAEFDSSMVADVLDIKRICDIKSRQTQPVWLQLSGAFLIPLGNISGQADLPRQFVCSFGYRTESIR